MRLALLLVVLAACSTRPLPDPFDAGAVATDLATTPDLGCLQPWPLHQLHVDDLNQCPLDLLRMTLQIVVDACQPVGPVEVTYDSSANSYTLTAQACAMPVCHGPPLTVERTVFLSETARPRPGMVIVRDGAGGIQPMPVPIQSPLADGLCGTVGGVGCRSDAQCEMTDSRTRCWYDGGRCARLCTTDADCASPSRCQLGLCI
jgi:hypothetical protein